MKYPSNEKDHEEVKQYLLQRYAVSEEKLFSKDCELYILNNSNATHYFCYRVRWCNKGKYSGWVFEEYDSLKHTNKELSIPTPNTKGFKGIWKFLNILLEEFEVGKVRCLRMKCPQQGGPPNCLLF